MRYLVAEHDGKVSRRRINDPQQAPTWVLRQVVERLAIHEAAEELVRDAPDLTVAQQQTIKRAFSR